MNFPLKIDLLCCSFFFLAIIAVYQQSYIKGDVPHLENIVAGLVKKLAHCNLK